MVIPKSGSSEKVSSEPAGVPVALCSGAVPSCSPLRCLHQPIRCLCPLHDDASPLSSTFQHLQSIVTVTPSAINQQRIRPYPVDVRLAPVSPKEQPPSSTIGGALGILPPEARMPATTDGLESEPNTSTKASYESKLWQMVVSTSRTSSTKGFPRLMAARFTMSYRKATLPPAQDMSLSSDLNMLYSLWAFLHCFQAHFPLP